MEKEEMLKLTKTITVLAIMSLLVAACGGATPTPAATQPPANTEAPAVTEAPVATEAPTEPPAPAEPKIYRLVPLSSDFGTIDPSLATQSAEIQIVETTSLGVVRQNETTAELELAFATGYDVSADGLTYTVKLMQGVPWVHYNAGTGKVEVVKDCQGKDRTVTAQDFAYGIIRTINPATASHGRSAERAVRARRLRPG